MTKTEQLNILFDSWETEITNYSGYFVRDGIINEDEWNNTNPKILFIAKEPNHYGNPRAGDFRNEWQNGISNYPFAYRIAEWSFGLIEGFQEYTKISYEKKLYQNYLQKIAFLNVKKSGGDRFSVMPELLDHVNLERQIENLKKQIEIIQPEIVILCLSFDLQLREKLFPGLNDEMEQTGYSIEVGMINKIKVIDFYHPSSRNSPPASYSLLQNVVNSKVYQKLL